MTLDKSPDAFRTISEVADDLDLPQHVLRFWETRFPQIKPMKRGGGRRYYRPEDVDLLKGIRHLLYDHGYTIKGVQKLLKTNGNKFVISVGHGDLASVEALASGVQETGSGEPRVAWPRRTRSSAAPSRRSPAGSQFRRRRRRSARSLDRQVERGQGRQGAAAGGALRPPRVQASARSGALKETLLRLRQAASSPVRVR